MNKIASVIIRRLLYAPKLRYAQIKPKLTEGNLFTYHLRKLINEGLIKKDKEGFYSLTAQGKLYTDRLSLKTLSPRIQPKIVTMLVIEDEKGKHLVYKRRRQPFSGSIGFPHGKIHLGESIVDAANRELQEKAGFNTPLSHRGAVYAAVFQDGELVTHILCHIFSGRVKNQNPKSTDKHTRCYWETLDLVDSSKYMPAFKDIHRLCQEKKDYFFSEFTYFL